MISGLRMRQQPRRLPTTFTEVMHPRPPKTLGIQMYKTMLNSNASLVNVFENPLSIINYALWFIPSHLIVRLRLFKNEAF